MRRYITLCCLAVSLILQVSAADAAIYTVIAEGTIDSIEEDGLTFGGNITSDTFTFAFDFNTAVADGNPDDARGLYHFIQNSASSAFGGRYLFNSGYPAQGFDIVIGTDPDSEVLVRIANATSYASPPPGVTNQISIHLSNPHVPLSSDALVPELFDLDLWDDADYSFRSAGDGGSATITGHINTLTVAVPEPASGVLLLGGLFALARRSRR